MKETRNKISGFYLFKTGKINDAEKVLREDLVKNPNNGWSLYLLSQCENTLGHRKEAQELDKKFHIKWQDADINVPLFF